MSKEYLNLWRRFGVGLGGAAVFVGLVVLVGGYQFSAEPMNTTGEVVFEDNFERTELGPQYRQGKPDLGHPQNEWRIEDFCAIRNKDAGPKRTRRAFKEMVSFGLTLEFDLWCNRRLVGENIHNAALWLKKELPERLRVEFTAEVLSKDGDVKTEIFGDGRTHQSGYIVIHGGWSNQLNIIARQDEHGEDRKEDGRCRTRDRKRRCVVQNRIYKWALERTDGTLKWYLDGELFLTYPDSSPVFGRHFAFNNWKAKVAFDDLKIFAVPETSRSN